MSIWVDRPDDYLAACHAAATDDEVFANFKRQAALLEVWEHVPENLGKAYLYVTKGLDLECDFRPALVNDRFGNPFTFELSDGYSISPTTCRYIWTYYMLRKLFGPLEDVNIIEIGGGYGGQAVVVHSYETPNSYVIYDLVEVAELQRRYFAACECAAFPVTTVGITYACDLLISTFALSELTAEQQDEYADKIIRHAPRGFLVCNDGDTQATLKLIKKLGKKNVEAEYEPVYTDSYIVWWGAK